MAGIASIDAPASVRQTACTTLGRAAA
jgi:hypothetical protein